MAAAGWILLLTAELAAAAEPLGEQKCWISSSSRAQRREATVGIFHSPASAASFVSVASVSVAFVSVASASAAAPQHQEMVVVVISSWPESLVDRFAFGIVFRRVHHPQ